MLDVKSLGEKIRRKTPKPPKNDEPTRVGQPSAARLAGGEASGEADATALYGGGVLTLEQYLFHLLEHFKGVRHQLDTLKGDVLSRLDPFAASLRTLIFDNEAIKIHDTSLYQQLFVACSRGESSDVVKFFESLRDDDTMPTPIQPLATLAATHGRSDLVQYCLENGAVFDYCLDEAARFGARDTKMLNVLYDANWKDMQTSNHQMNKLMKGCLLKGHNSMDWLLDHGGKFDVDDLKASARANVDVQRLARAVEMSGGISILERSGALQESARVGDLEKLKYLVEGGLDVNQVMRYSALYLAVEAKHVEVVRYLLDHGANIGDAVVGSFYKTNTEFGGEETHLDVARRIGNKDILDLVEAKARQENIL